MRLPDLLVVLVVARDADPQPVVVGLADPTANPTSEHPPNLVGLGAQLVDPIKPQSSVLAPILSLCL